MHGAKWLGAMVGSLLIGAAAPASAQNVGGYDRSNFVKAVKDEDEAKVRELFDKHGKIILDAHGANNDTALTVAIRARNEWAYFFLSEGANPNEAGANGDTPLIIAARIGSVGIAEQLLVRKADIDKENDRGETPLIVAVQARQVPMVKLLLDHGANPDKTDHFAGRSARDYAKQDTRAREILATIEAESRDRKPKAAPQSADDFRL